MNGLITHQMAMSKTNLNPSFSKEQQNITQICALCAQLLLQNGAESALIDMLSTRLGKSLGAQRVELAISTNFIVLSTIDDNSNEITVIRKISEAGINMQAISGIHHIVQAAERGELNAKKVQNALHHIYPVRYPKWFVSVVVGLACACICRMAGGSIGALGMTFIVASIAMIIRQNLANMRIHPLVNVCITAFITVMGGGLMLRFIPIATPTVMLSSSLLLLVPGYPLICSLSDIFKGYINTGISRWVVATTLTLAACIGVVTAVSIFGINEW